MFVVLFCFYSYFLFLYLFFLFTFTFLSFNGFLLFFSKGPSCKVTAFMNKCITKEYEHRYERIFCISSCLNEYSGVEGKKEQWFLFHHPRLQSSLYRDRGHWEFNYSGNLVTAFSVIK